MERPMTPVEERVAAFRDALDDVDVSYKFARIYNEEKDRFNVRVKPHRVIPPEYVAELR